MEDIVIKNMEQDNISIADENGKERMAEVLLYFSFEDSETEEEEKAEYVIYTFHEVDENNLVILYSSILEKAENGDILLKDIESDEEWTRIKSVMRHLIKTGKGEA